MLHTSRCVWRKSAGGLLTKSLTLPERKELLQTHVFSRPQHYSTFYDFDAWVYSTEWPSPMEVERMGGAHPSLPLGGGKCSLVVEELSLIHI